MKWSMITGSQIRSARAALGWSARKLAEEAKIGFRTISRLEDVDDVPESRTATLTAVQRAMEAAGIEFIGVPEDGPGIRIHRKA